MSESLAAQVSAALSRIKNPRLENDLLSAGMVRDLVVAAEGRVTFTFLLSREDPATLVRETKAALKGLDGVTEVKITVVDPGGAAQATHGPPGPTSAMPQSTGMIPAPTPSEMPHLGKVIAVSSGKGGVGKSTVAANLGIALARRGKRVGILDADVYGPNIPRMFGRAERPMVVGGKIQPLEAFGVKLISIGFLVERDQAAIWRGPIVMKVIQQFLRDVEWGELDYLIVDMPPGTGDAQLSLVQSIVVSGAVIVTTPQEMAVGDALRGAKMFERVKVPVLGIVENMGGFTDPDTGKRFALFSSGGGQRLAAEVGCPLLGEVPLQPGLAELADRGQPILVEGPETPAGRALAKVAEGIERALLGRSMPLPIFNP